LREAAASFITSATSKAGFPPDDLPEVALLGRSNVGKSSLLNALCGTRRLARTSAQPGRTRAVNFFRVGNELVFADLPGYGYARVPEALRVSWERLASEYLLGRRALRLSLLLVDARHDAMESDLTLRQFLEHHRLPYLVAATKADKLGRGELVRREAAIRRDVGAGALGVVATSATTGAGIDALWKAIRQQLRGRAIA
jgi:GTP-binding protein